MYIFSYIQRAAQKRAIVRTCFFRNRWGGGHAATCARAEVTLKTLYSKSNKFCYTLEGNIFIIL